MSGVPANPERLLLALDEGLDHKVQLVIYGRSALWLGFDNPPAVAAATFDVDAIIPVPCGGCGKAALRRGVGWGRLAEHIGGRDRGGRPTEFMIELLTSLWLFNTAVPAHSALTAQVPGAEFTAPASPTNGFTVRFRADLKELGSPRSLIEISNVLSVRLRQHDPLDRNRQNYPAFKMPDGSVPVLEATVALHSVEHPDWKDMTIGIPLALLKQPAGEHDIVLNFTGVRWTMYVDGDLLDNDFPFGYPHWGDRTTWSIDPEHVRTASLHCPALDPLKKPAPVPGPSPEIQYWLPPGHNTWVGDVATLFHHGRYHVFYLFDRRHHASKFGCGAHYFEHLSTTDFRTWTEHEAATPIEEQWECIGTGVPFVHSNTLCLSYGLHTTRVHPAERTSLPAQWEYLNKNGRTRGFSRETTPGFPAGSTYAVSADGVATFKKSHIMFHPCENPSVYTDPSGRLRMMANYRSSGIWESESPDGGWRCINPGFPPGGDCTFFFRWGRFDYINGGFTGLWSKPADAPISAYEDVVRTGQDFYDGLAVPSIAEIAGGRFLMAGWIPVRGWGGCLAIRELVQFPDGRIGSKWMKEIAPEAGTPVTLAAAVDDTATFPTDGKSFLLTFNAHPSEAGKGRVGVAFLPETGEQAACEFQMRLDDRRAQFGPGSSNRFAGIEKSLREGGAAHSIENLPGVDRPFAVRVIVKGNDKLGGSLVDAEIAGQRTLISYRPDLTVRKLAWRTEGVECRDIRLAPLVR
jgi:hypothetical protein